MGIPGTGGKLLVILGAFLCLSHRIPALSIPSQLKPKLADILVVRLEEAFA